MIQKIAEIVGAIVFAIWTGAIFIIAIIVAISKHIWQSTFNDNDYEN